MHIRSYKPTDLSACKRLYTELVQTHRELYHDETIGAPDPSAGFVNQLQQRGNEAFWVAEEKGKVVGLIGLIIEGEDGIIEPLVVAKTHRKRGIGTMLLKHLIDVAKTNGLRFLNIRPVARNRNAIRCFHRAGFQTIGFIEVFMDLRGDFVAEEELTFHDKLFDW